jgi:hypothetical protein
LEPGAVTDGHDVFACVQPPSKCRQALPAHGAANLKAFVGFTGSERASSSSVTGYGSLRCAKRGSSTIPLPTPNETVSSIPTRH